jgi:hypothetical protein
VILQMAQRTLVFPVGLLEWQRLTASMSMYHSCAQFGFLTMFPGNKTHNAVCILEPLPTEPHGQLTIMFLAVAICILVLTTAQLSLHIWQLRKQRMWSRGQLCPGEVGGGPQATC